MEFFPWKSMSRARIDQTLSQTMWQKSRNFKHLHLYFSFVLFICVFCLCFAFVFAFFSHWHFWLCVWIISFCICAFYLCFDSRVAFTFVLVLSTHAPKIPGPVNVRTLPILPSNDVKIYIFPSHVCELCVWVLVCFLWKPMPRVWISQTLSQAMWQSPKF